MKRNRLREYRKKNIKPGAADLDAIAVFPKGHILSHSVLFGRKTYLREGMKGRTFFYSQFCDKTEEKHSSVPTIQPVLCLVFCQLSSFFSYDNCVTLPGFFNRKLYGSRSLSFPLEHMLFSFCDILNKLRAIQVRISPIQVTT